MNKKYTVLLLYPDYLGDYGDETCLEYVWAPIPEDAEFSAKQQAMDDTAHYIHYRDDFKVLAVFKGHLDNLKK